MKRLNKYLKKRESEIRLLLETEQRDCSATTFHKLRIEIKKLKAVMMLINNSCSGFKYKKTFDPFKNIFRQAGKVRELQIEKEMMKRYNRTPTLKEYRNWLNASLIHEQAVFFRLINEKTKSKLNKIFSTLESFIAKMNKKKTLIYLHKQQMQIQKLLHTTSLTNEQTHDLRQRLKVYEYSRRILRINDEFTIFAHQEELILLLGEWHDGQENIQHLSNAMVNIKIPPAGIEQLQEIKEKIYSQNEILFTKINAIRSEIFRQA